MPKTMKDRLRIWESARDSRPIDERTRRTAMGAQPCSSGDRQQFALQLEITGKLRSVMAYLEHLV